MSQSFLRRVWFDGVLFLCNRFVARIPSHRLRRWFYRHVMQFEIGQRSWIFMDARFDARRSFKLGNHSIVNEQCRLDNRGGLEIGENVSISSEVCILTADHDLQSAEFAGRNLPVRIEDYVFIGTRAMILPGVTVARGAVVAAGAVVTRNVPPMSIVAGCPAKEIGTRASELTYQINYCRLFA